MREMVQGVYAKYKIPAWIAGAAVVLAFPWIFASDTVLSIAASTLIFMILASALNVTNGYIGLFNIGSAGFFCLGAYTTALLSTRVGLGFFTCFFISAAFTAFVGALIAIPTSRFSGFYFSIVTMGFSEIVRLIMLNWVSLTKGSNGIHSIPRPALFGLTIKSMRQYYYLVLIILAITLFCIHRIIHSRVGRAWLSIRENPDAASSLGVKITTYKSLNFMVMGFFMGIGGSLMAYYYRYIAPEMFQIDNGHTVLAMVILGGMGSLPGPLIGAVILNLAMELFRFASEFRMIAYAIMVVAMMWLRPQGIIGATNTVMVSEKSSGRKKTGQRRPSEHDIAGE